MRPSATWLRGLRIQNRLLPQTTSYLSSPTVSAARIQSPISPISVCRQGASPLSRLLSRRHSSSASPSPPLTDRTSSEADDARHAQQNTIRRDQEPAYRLTFTCKPCGTRSSHHVSKHGYHRGTVLIRCPSCSNRHIISDHLQIFLDNASTLEDILKQTGRTLTKGYLEGDLELWEDDTIYKTTDDEPFTVGSAKKENETGE
jgi:mitochondrial protein import protein ZIM17